MQEQKMVAVARPRDETTAHIMRLALEDEGIPATVHAYHSSIFDGIFVPSEGAWGEVLVPEEYADQAKALLEQT